MSFIPSPLPSPRSVRHHLCIIFSSSSSFSFYTSSSWLSSSRSSAQMLLLLLLFLMLSPAPLPPSHHHHHHHHYDHHLLLLLLLFPILPPPLPRRLLLLFSPYTSSLLPPRLRRHHHHHHYDHHLLLLLLFPILPPPPRLRRRRHHPSSSSPPSLSFSYTSSSSSSSSFFDFILLFPHPLLLLFAVGYCGRRISQPLLRTQICPIYVVDGTLKFKNSFFSSSSSSVFTFTHKKRSLQRLRSLISCLLVLIKDSFCWWEFRHDLKCSICNSLTSNQAMTEWRTCFNLGGFSINRKLEKIMFPSTFCVCVVWNPGTRRKVGVELLWH